MGEIDALCSKVLGQLGLVLVALCRVSVSHMSASSKRPGRCGQAPAAHAQTAPKRLM